MSKFTLDATTFAPYMKAYDACRARFFGQQHDARDAARPQRRRRRRVVPSLAQSPPSRRDSTALEMHLIRGLERAGRVQPSYSHNLEATPARRQARRMISTVVPVRETTGSVGAGQECRQRARKPRSGLGSEHFGKRRRTFVARGVRQGAFRNCNDSRAALFDICKGRENLRVAFARSG